MRKARRIMPAEGSQADARGSTSVATKTTLLRLTSISKAFGGVQTLRGVSFDLYPGSGSDLPTEPAGIMTAALLIVALGGGKLLDTSHRSSL